MLAWPLQWKLVHFKTFLSHNSLNFYKKLSLFVSVIETLSLQYRHRYRNFMAYGAVTGAIEAEVGRMPPSFTSAGRYHQSWRAIVLDSLVLHRIVHINFPPIDLLILHFIIIEHDITPVHCTIIHVKYPRIESHMWAMTNNLTWMLHNTNGKTSSWSLAASIGQYRQNGTRVNRIHMQSKVLTS